jgi:hypothetical protein
LKEDCTLKIIREINHQTFFSYKVNAIVIAAPSKTSILANLNKATSTFFQKKGTKKKACHLLLQCLQKGQ